jgi:hypothetical protein
MAKISEEPKMADEGGLTPEQHDAIVTTVQGFLGFVDRVELAHLTEPANDSRAAMELAQINPGRQHNLVVVSEMAATRLVVARSQLEAAAAVLDLRDAIPPIAVLARSALEAAGRAWWLLDPEISADRRLARFEAEYLYGLEQRCWIVEDEPRLSANARADLDRHHARVMSYELPVERRPGSTELIERLLQPPKSAMKRPGRVMYRLLSGWPHASVHAILMDVDFFSSTWHPMNIAFIGCFNALDRLFDYAQIAIEEWRIWARDTLEKLVQLAPAAYDEEAPPSGV